MLTASLTVRQLVRGLPALALAGCVACGGGSPASEPAQSPITSAPVTAPDIAASSALMAYFHEQLVANGEDVQSDFGSALVTLDLNPRDLQQDTPEHAYQTTLQKVQAVQDAAQRAELTRALFGRETTPAR